jgi:8-oxo-dGTP pyrophosphatase MutT (NUDIX family)
MEPAPPRILDPRSVPVTGTDSFLPAIAPARLSAAALRDAVGSAAGWAPPIAGDGRLFAGREPAAAAVLMPLVMRADGLHMLLTRRTEHLRDHAGQISFPGGRSEPGDADAAATALREAEEEVGLDPALAEVIGSLPTYTTVTGFVVTPVLALVQPALTLRLDRFEVAEAFEVPLPFLMNPAHHQRHTFNFAGGERQFLSMPWNGYFIWGATAAMLRNLYHLLAR